MTAMVFRGRSIGVTGDVLLADFGIGGILAVVAEVGRRELGVDQSNISTLYALATSSATSK